MIEYSIVIPAYNEADKITSSLTQVLGFMRTFSKSFEVIVSDDGSTDNTARLVHDYAKTNPEVKLLKNKHKGKSPTVWAGVMEAEGEYIYMCDADLSTPIDELKKMMLWITEHDNDIVICSREGPGSVRIGEPLYRHIIGRCFNLWVQFWTLPGIHDSQCGFKLFKKHVAKEVFGLLKIYGQDAKEIKGAAFGAFDVEVLFLARKLGYKIKELPTTWKYVKTTRFNFFSNSFGMAFAVVKVRLNDLRGVYK